MSTKSIALNGNASRQTPTSSPIAHRLAAIYARVSSEEQRENQTIKTQIEAAKRWVEFQKMVNHPLDIADLYLDDGVSGTIALADRPAGKRLLDDAGHGRFALVLVYKIDRLGRDPRDILNATHRLDQLGVAVKSLTEEFDLSTPSGKFMFNVFAAAAGFARDSQLERMSEAINHWAREGAWLGGVVPFGYRVVGKKKEARLVIADTPIPGLQLSEPDVVHMVYRLLGEEGWTCVKIAEHFNRLGIPTAYTLLQRKVKEKATSGAWTYSSVRKLAANPVYKGEHHFGKRSKKSREVIIRPVPALVNAELWERAQDALRRNMLLAMRNAKYQYLLRGLIKCGICGMAMAGHGIGRRSGRVHYYYVCGGKNPHRSRIHGKCPSKHLPATRVEEDIWQQIVNYLHDPDELLDKLAQEQQRRQEQMQDLEQERVVVAVALSHKDAEKEQILNLYRRRLITEADLERQFTTIAAEAAELKARLSTLETTMQGQEAIAARQLGVREVVDRLRTNFKPDLPWEEKREYVEDLIEEIVVAPPDEPDKMVVTYVFKRNADSHTVCSVASARRGCS